MKDIVDRFVALLGGNPTLTTALQTIAALLGSLVAIFGLWKFWSNRNRKTMEQIVKDELAAHTAMIAQMLEKSGYKVSVPTEAVVETSAAIDEGLQKRFERANARFKIPPGGRSPRRPEVATAYIVAARSDLEKAEEIAHRLNSIGARAFLPERDGIVHAGTDWQVSLRRHIEQSDVAIIVWSRAAVASQAVRAEIDLILHRLQEQEASASKGIKLQVVQLDDTPLPRELAQYQFSTMKGVSVPAET
jgi:hypothetical protein